MTDIRNVTPAPGGGGHLPSGEPKLPETSIWLGALWLVPVLVYWALDRLTQQRRRRVFRGAEPGRPAGEPGDSNGDRSEVRGHGDDGDPELPPDGHCRCPSVLLASLEHCLPHRGVKVIAGGLGKVVTLIAKHHPSDLTMVHPMVGGDDTNYGPADAEEEPLEFVVDGRREVVRVWRFSTQAAAPSSPSVDFLLLEHPHFLGRDRSSIYPNPMSRIDVLAFFSIWNQAVGALLLRRRPEVFHCPDYHTAVAPWYALSPSYPELRVLLVLHNAEYQGSFSTDQIRGQKLQRVARIFNLPVDIVQQHMVHDGQLNLLKAAVGFLRMVQGGRGACAVSKYYAEEVWQLYSLLWPLRGVEGLENPMLEEERKVPRDCSQEDLQRNKLEAKLRLQKDVGLKIDPDARLFVSLGRLVRQKGVDLLADITVWLLEKYSNTQLIFAGPVADGFGHYASHHLQQLMEDPRYSGRLFVKCEFWQHPDICFAADFCLMPSRDEPFGYVDVEFAWCGALVVGAQAGGLGKVPGFYYVAQNRENLGRLRRELRTAVALAMACTTDDLQEMREAAVRCSFPLDTWRRELASLYRSVLPSGAPEGRCWGSPAGDRCQRCFSWCRRRSRLPGADQVSGLQELQTMASRGGEPPRELAGTCEEGQEFLVQELSEKELQVRMAEKMHDCQGIDEILELVACDVDTERETTAASRWLLRPLGGTPRVHWVIASAYVLSPLSQVLSYIMATEWGLRAPPLKFQARLIGQALNGPMDPALLNLILYSFNALGLMVAAPLWTSLCRVCAPSRVLAASQLTQLLLLAALLPLPPFLPLAVLLMFVHGLTAGASMLYIVFNFMMSIRADLGQAALRMGRLETVRYCVSWLASGYVFLASPSSLAGTAERPLPAKVLWRAAPLGILVASASLLIGLLCLQAPRPYREDRFPGWDLSAKLVLGRRSFLLLGLSECLGSLTSFPAMSYVTWWLANGWEENDLAELCAGLAAILAAGILVWAQVLSLASMHGFSLLIGVAVFLPPSSLLSATSQQEVSTWSATGRSTAAMLICALALLFQGIQSSALWAAKIRILGSRWRLLSYGTVLLSASQFCTLLSPILCEYIARRSGASFLTRNEKELANAISACAPVAVLQYLLQLGAAHDIHKDMGSARARTDVLSMQVPSEGAAGPAGGPPPAGGPRRRRAARQGLRRCWRWCTAGGQRFAARWPKIVASVLGLALLATAVVIQWQLVEAPLQFRPVRRCHAAPTVSGTQGCRELETLHGPTYARNRYGQETTATMACMSKMYHYNGDTFQVNADAEICIIYSCKTEAKLSQSYTSMVWSGGIVFSRLCSIYGQNLVMVHLFEWKWSDVEKECENYLGPAGFDAVQVSPPAEHVTGSPWFTRYQPVSYKLESRSGTEDEFIQMVAACRNAGVQVLVDAVINHMAGPILTWPWAEKCNASGKIEDNSTCMGWSWTRYGNRVFDTSRGTYGYYDFHHYHDNEASNCALPPWTNNRHLCDLQGLPDLDTESSAVQDKIVLGYLARLYEIGVTMLRIDAAMLIYPASLAYMLERVPFEYIVQEYYPNVLTFETRTYRDATTISPLTNFDYGTHLAEILFDYQKTGKAGKQWVDNSESFAELVNLNHAGTKYPDKPLPVDRGLQFLDNHDQQRERWKACPSEAESPGHTCDVQAQCAWDGSDIGICRPIYKHGEIYNLAMLFTLSWPFGDSVRLMSSFSWTYFNDGPPGTRVNASRDVATSVWDLDQPTRCKATPRTSPVTVEYDTDAEHPWVCEHRWLGVAGLVWLRKRLGESCGPAFRNCWVQNRNSTKEGRACFSVAHDVRGGDVETLSFVALSRGFNWLTQKGSNRTWDLRGQNTSLPAGTYCNLGAIASPIRSDVGFPLDCPFPHIVVAQNRTIASGTVDSISGSGVVAIHANYRLGLGPSRLPIAASRSAASLSLLSV